jgi:uncharacterized protein
MSPFAEGIMKILVTGSSGLVGSALVSFLEKRGEQVSKLVRGKTELEGFDAVVHLAGENIMGRWTETKKNRIRESRVKGTQLLSQALIQLKKPPSVFVCASAIGYYGNRGEEILTEQSAKGEGFLADVCGEWEEATRTVAEKGIRTINLRIGMVLSLEGGALRQMLPMFKLGLGGKMGSGSQSISWIAIDDLVRIIDDVIYRENLAGPINAVAPHPVTNEELTKTLGQLLHRPTFLSLPVFMVKLIFGELGEELLLSSARVKPKKLEENDFQWNYPYLEGALKHLLDKSS